MRIVLNTPRYRGEYEFDLEQEPLTNLEWRWVKKISGYLPMTIQDGWAGGDPDLFVAFAVVALVRNGRVTRDEALAAAELLAEAPFDGAAIVLLGDDQDDEEEAAAVPPAEPAPTPATAPPLRSIGGSSPSTSDHRADDLRGTGALA